MPRGELEDAGMSAGAWEQQPGSAAASCEGRRAITPPHVGRARRWRLPARYCGGDDTPRDPQRCLRTAPVVGCTTGPMLRRPPAECQSEGEPLPRVVTRPSRSRPARDDLSPGADVPCSGKRDASGWRRLGIHRAATVGQRLDREHQHAYRRDTERIKRRCP